MEDLANLVHQRITQVRSRIDAAAQAVNRDAEAVRLVVVTKAQPLDTVEAALQAGAEILGENYPEESLPKIEALKGKYRAEWHMIGHLQSRKAGIVASHFDLYQSLDRLDIALRMENLLAGLGRRLPVLLEFNTGGEGSKSGWDAANETTWDGLIEATRQVHQLPHLEVRGLMTMPPLFENAEEARPFFVRLRKLGDFLSAAIPGIQLREYSMGTSSDFEVAVQEGATLVRVGTAILGPRPARQ
jgi:PLP dependent protein